MKKVFGVVFLVLAVCMMVLIVQSFINIPVTRSNLEEGVWSRDGSYHPENEGKIVTILLDVQSLENAYDSDMDIHFKTPIVKRHVEKLVEVPTAADGIWEWEWREIYEAPEGGIGQKLFVGQVQGDILQLDPSIEKMLPRGESLSIDDLTEESRQSIEKKIGVWVGISKTYFSDAGSAVFGEELVAHSIIHPLFHDEGKLRIWYETTGYDDHTVFSITGVQRGRTLEKADNLDMSAVNKQVRDSEELIRLVTKDLVVSIVFFILVDVVLIYVGLRWLGILKKGLFIRKKPGKAANNRQP